MAHVGGEPGVSLDPLLEASHHLVEACGERRQLNLATDVESGIEFVRNDIILQTMGPAGLPWTPFLVTMFFFIFTDTTVAGFFRLFQSGAAATAGLF